MLRQLAAVGLLAWASSIVAVCLFFRGSRKGARR